MLNQQILSSGLIKIMKLSSCLIKIMKLFKMTKHKIKNEVLLNNKML